MEGKNVGTAVGKKIVPLNIPLFSLKRLPHFAFVGDQWVNFTLSIFQGEPCGSQYRTFSRPSNQSKFFKVYYRVFFTMITFLQIL
jgi:hypothetical protein